MIGDILYTFIIFCIVASTFFAYLIQNIAFYKRGRGLFTLLVTEALLHYVLSVFFEINSIGISSGIRLLFYFLYLIMRILDLFYTIYDDTVVKRNESLYIAIKNRLADKKFFQGWGLKDFANPEELKTYLNQLVDDKERLHFYLYIK